MPINIVDSEIGVFEASSSAADNLSHHWSMNEIHDSTANDVQGDSDGTIKDGVDFSTDISFTIQTFDNLPYYIFNGNDDSYISLPKSYSSSGALSAVTVGAWVKADNTANDKVIIGFDSSEYFRLMVQSNGNVQWSTTDSTNNTHHLSGSTNVDDGNWHFVAGTYDVNNPKQKRIHVDGEEDFFAATAHSSNDLGSGTTRFGFIGDDSEASSEDGSTSGDEFEGDMATVFIYEEEALTNQQLSDIHSAGNVAVPPDFTIPSSDITSMDISQRIENQRDTGRIKIENNDGSYNVGSNEINSGDLLRFRTRLEGESSLSQRWSAMAETILYEQRDYNRENIRIKATDFVFGIISNRLVEDTFEGLDFTSIVNNVVKDEASEVYTDRVQSMSGTTDSFPRGTSLLNLLNELGGKANAIVSNRDRSLVFEKAKKAPFAFTLSDSDKGPHIIRKEGADIANSVRVDGGINQSIDDQQTTQSSTKSVTESSRITHQLSTRKATVDRIDLYTSDSGSGEDVKIRLQKDDGGSPVAVGDEESDIVSETLSPTDTEYTDGGLSTFHLNPHILPEPDPWMIIESSGLTGQDIGVDGSDNPRYDAYFQFRVVTLNEAFGSIEEHRKREAKVVNEKLNTRTAAKEAGASTVRHNKEPDVFIEFNAESTRAHNVNPAEVITVDETNASGDFLVVDKTTTYEGLKLTTEVEAQKVSSI